MKITFNSSTYVYLAILLFILPVKWLIAWLVAVCFHEACHYLAVKLCGGESYRLCFRFGGAEMFCSGLTVKQHLFALLAGPFGGLLPVLLGRYFPRLALCCWALSLYNMLPLQPLDGGQALRLLIKNNKSFRTAERVILIILTLGSIYASLQLHLGMIPFVITGMLWMKNRNSPCKERACKVQ